MSEKERLWSATKAAQARAKAKDLDRQARELERSAELGDWRQRARIGEAASRLRLRAGTYLIEALRIEEIEGY
ncbi:MAG: hypothetical protein DI584_07280 [Stenotrophomonas sp.]|nr:MAG: hypothetical protein DI584_07280 [Stenotrophomonas sp.]